MVKGLGYRQENSWFPAGRQWGAMECLGPGGYLTYVELFVRSVWN